MRFTLSLCLCLLVPFITMAQAPVANFTASVTSGCAPLSVHFTDQSTNSPKSWYWDLGNGLSQSQNPDATFAAGTYTIILTVKNADGVSSVTKTNLIVSNPSPSANYTADKRTSCAPGAIQFTDLSVANAGTINSWQWDFGDPNGNSTSTAPNPIHTYTTAGYYNVSLKVTSTTGCSSQAFNARYIRIVNGVKANFDYTPPATCTAPFSVPFKNLTSGPGNLTYSWDFGNGATSTGTTPTASYAATGTYVVKLTAQSDFGCSDVIQKNVSVSGSSTAFTAPANVCLGDAATFQSTASPAPTKVLWNFGDGTTSDKLSVTKTYTAAGTYTVKLYTTFGTCSDSAIKTITVNDKPVTTFSSTKNVTCKAPLTVTFNNTSPDFVSSSWTFGDGATSTSPSPTHTYTTVNGFTVSLSITDSKGCKNTITSPNYINIFPPEAHIQNLPPSACVNQTINPTSYTPAGDGVQFYSWDFGDATPPVTTANASHFYPVAGDYVIKLSVITYDGCTASTSSNIHIGLRPNINFTVDKNTLCHSQLATFTNLTTPTNSTPILWNFGDGTTNNSFNPPPHKFTDSGYYNITLTVTSDGCTDSTVKMNYVHVTPPVADFGYSIPDCSNKTAVQFSDSTFNVAALYGPLAYKWNFGDPAVPDATTQNPNVTYPSLGTYNVKLIVNNSTCFDTIIKPVTLVDVKAQMAALAKTTFCRNEPITFTSTNNNNVKAFSWVVDGVPATGGSSFTTSFSASGTHNVKLVITDINGCKDSTAPQSVTITGPTALFTVMNKGGCANSTITVIDGSYPSAGNTLTKWVFNFGDGTGDISFNSQPFTHKYADTGVYDIKLVAYDNTSNNCIDTYTLTGAAVITRPKANFGSLSTVFCPNTNLQFSDSSSGKALTYKWYFGDGGTDTYQNPAHMYPPVDSAYTVKLVVTDSVGCSDSLTRNKYIAIRSPKSAFIAEDTLTFCPPLQTYFFSRAKDYASIEWNFGDGTPNIPDDTTPSHFYNSVGKYTAKLYAYGYGGCADSSSFVINVLDPYAATTINFDPKTACNELNVTFDLTIPQDVKYSFGFGDGNSHIDSLPQTNFQHLYASPGVYQPLVLLSDKTGCQAYVASYYVVNIKGGVSIFGMDKKKFCDSGTIYFTDFSQQQPSDPIVSKAWDFGDGTAFPTNGDTTHTYKQPGLYTPGLTVNTAAGCSKTYTDTVRVLATPKPVITSDEGVCNDLAIDFTGSLLVPPDTAIVWKWDLSGGQTSSQQNVSIHYADTGLHHIALQATNSLGCKGDTTKDIIVYPLPVIKVAGDTTVLSGSGGAIIPLTYSSNVTTYNWTPPTNLSCTDCANPFANIKFTTTYTVKATDVNGCVSTRDVTMVALCNGKNFFIPNTFSPNNDGNNDVFYPRGKGLERIQALRIFNRWGEMVFEKRNFPANDATSGWDGTYKGQKAGTDTYVYMIDIICENAVIITYKGNITLIR